VHALDGRAAGRADLVAQRDRVFAGLERELRAAQNRLAGDVLRERARQPRLDAGGGERVDIEVDVWPLP
jgi:hypothetical protein